MSVLFVSELRSNLKLCTEKAPVLYVSLIKVALLNDIAVAPVTFINSTTDVIFQLAPVIQSNDSDNDVWRISTDDWLELEPFAFHHFGTLMHLQSDVVIAITI